MSPSNKHQPFGEDLAQFGEIVLHNLIESMRVQDIVDVGEGRNHITAILV
jgi:hypothetical protein